MIFDINASDEFIKLVRENRSRELFDMDTKLSYGHLIVYGSPGVGKTTLLQAFARLDFRNYRKIGFHRGYEVEMNGSLLDSYLVDQQQDHFMQAPELIIIDGFDEIRSSAIKEKIAHIMREGRKIDRMVILSARSQINEKIFEQLSQTMFLRGLSKQHIDQLFNSYKYVDSSLIVKRINAKFDGNYVDLDLAPILKRFMADFDGNPREIKSALHLLFSNTQTDDPQLIYQNPALIEELQKPTLLVAEHPKIITDIQVVNTRILDRIGRRPEAIYELKPRQFEMLVAELLEERGYDVELTKQTRDGGKDLIIINRSDIGNFLIYAECKRYAPDNPVGVRVVSDLAGRMDADRVTAGLVITSSYFSPDAKIFQEKIKHKMTLVDFVKLTSMITNDPRNNVTKTF